MTPAHPSQPSTTNPTFQFLIGRMTSANRSESYKMTDIHPCIHPMTSDNRSTLRATKGFMFRINVFNYHTMKMVLAFDSLYTSEAKLILLCFQQHCKLRVCASLEQEDAFRAIVLACSILLVWNGGGRICLAGNHWP